MFNNYAVVQGVDHVVPVDMYLPGCPPRPEMLMDAILKLHAKITDEPLGQKRAAALAESGYRTPMVPSSVKFAPKSKHLGALKHTRNQDVPNLLDWAGEANLTIVSPGYRLAPEHPYPVPVEDCYTGLLWTVEHRAGPVALGGISAGGGLAAIACALAGAC